MFLATADVSILGKKKSLSNRSMNVHIGISVPEPTRLYISVDHLTVWSSRLQKYEILLTFRPHQQVLAKKCTLGTLSGAITILHKIFACFPRPVR